MDRIVNIYSINSNKAKKKKFYINMASAARDQNSQLPSASHPQKEGNNPSQQSPSFNEDIRVKLR